MNFKSIFALFSITMLVPAASAMEEPTLLEAVENIDLRRIKKVLEDDDLNDARIIVNNSTPLLYASSNGYTPIVRILLEHKDVAKLINFPDKEGLTSLHHACIHGHYPVVELLVEKGACVNEVDKEKRTALYCASDNNYDGIVKLLLKNGALINKDVNGSTPLHIVAHKGHVSIVKTLLEHDACSRYINEGDKDKRTALHYASDNNHVEIVKLLLGKGACINKDIDGFTPLHKAAGKNRLPIVKALLDRDGYFAYINEGDKDKRTALYYAAYGNCADIVELLLKKGAFINGKDTNGYTALHIAAYEKCLSTVKVLLNGGAYFTYKTSFGRTAAELARGKGYNHIAEVIEGEVERRKQKMEEEERAYMRKEQCIRWLKTVDCKKNFDLDALKAVARK